MISVHFNGKEFEVKCPAFDNERIKAAPDRRWDKKSGAWKAPSTRAVAMYLAQNYADSEKTNEAQRKIKELKTIEVSKDLFPAWFKFNLPPMKHQMEALNQIWGNNEAALFMAMRTGKTFVAINWAAALAMEGKVQGMIVVTLSAITFDWEDQLIEHSPIPTNTHTIKAGNKDRTQRWIDNQNDDGFKVMVLGVEALSQGNAWEYMRKFAMKHKCVMIIDESSSIKNSTSIRSKRIIDVGGLCKNRAILTGTPITQGIQDLFGQFKFLNWNIIGIKSEFAYRARYCIMGGFEQRQVVGYRHIGEIMDNVKPYVYQITTEEANPNLPEKIFELRLVEPNKTQKRLFKELGDKNLMATNIDDLFLETETVLERMIRYQQIAGGHFPYGNDEGGYDIIVIPETSPKLKAMMQDIEILPKDTKILIWSVFRPEIELIVEALTKKYGLESCVQFHGGVDKDQRAANVRRFQTDPECRFFISNKSASKGVELSAADTHMFYSRSFSYEDNIQAEARTDSAKQEAESILYIDYRINLKIDKQIYKAYSTKRGMADYVTEAMSK